MKKPKNITVDCNDLDGFIEKIFSKPPGEPGSNKLNIQHSNEQQSDSIEHTNFHMLSQFLTRGIAYLYGEDTRTDHLTPDNIKLLQQYLSSLGYVAWIGDAEILAKTSLPQYRGYYLPYLLKIPNHDKTIYTSIMFCKTL